MNEQELLQMLMVVLDEQMQVHRMTLTPERKAAAIVELFDKLRHKEAPVSRILVIGLIADGMARAKRDFEQANRVALPDAAQGEPLTFRAEDLARVLRAKESEMSAFELAFRRQLQGRIDADPLHAIGAKAAIEHGTEVCVGSITTPRRL